MPKTAQDNALFPQMVVREIQPQLCVMTAQRDAPVFAARALPEPVGSMAKGSLAASCQSGLPSRPCMKSNPFNSRAGNRLYKFC